MKKEISKRKKKWIERTVANDRSSKRFLYNRFYLFAILVLLQIVGFAFLIYLFAYNVRIGVTLQAVVGILAIISVLHIINKHEGASTKLNWILIILIFPLFGVPLYLSCGEGRPARKMKRKIDKAKEDITRRELELFGRGKKIVPENRSQGILRYLSSQANFPFYQDGKVTYYASGEKMFPAIKEELEKAKKFILLEYFIIAHGRMWGDILRILLKKASEGVQIRIIYDDFGCMTTLPPDYDKYLESLNGNIRAISFNEVVPLFAMRMNNRDHRKMIVVDGKAAFTGGINLADEYIGEKRRFGYWKDSGIKVTGSSVRSFTVTFFQMWNAFKKEKEDVANYVEKTAAADANDGCVIQPYAVSPLDEKSVAERVYVDTINRAVKYVYIFTPYLLPNEAIRSALCAASERGVDVRIVTPGIPDKKLTYRLTRSNYSVLLKSGVKIYEYTPGFIHAKSVVCDDECAVVGTINFDYRSLYLHFENAVYFSGCEAVADVKRDCEETFAVSKRCTLENTKKSTLGRLWDSILRVFETLM